MPTFKALYLKGIHLIKKKDITKKQAIYSITLCLLRFYYHLYAAKLSSVLEI